MVAKKPILVTCLDCGTVIESNPSRQKEGRDVFCSRKCRYGVNAIRVEGDIAYLQLTTRMREPVAEAVIDAADASLIQALGKRWSLSDVRRKHETEPRYRVETRLEGKLVRLHRLLLDVPRSVGVDHLDGNGLNNCRANLRRATQAQNSQNRHGVARGPHFNNVSGARNVYWKEAVGKWEVKLSSGGQGIFLGVYETLSEAKAAAEAGRRKYLPYSIE